MQNNLNKYEEDCSTMVARIDTLLATDVAGRKHNRKVTLCCP